MDLGQLRDRIRDKVFSGASIDSREVKRNGVFFALKGEKVDGHDFLAEAAKNGATVGVVSEGYSGENFGLTLVKVGDVLQSLHRLAREIFTERNTRVLGVTGSVGKTTTKEFIATLLEKKFRLVKTPGTHNSQATFPLSILNSPGCEELFVMEMGMSLPGELTKLVDIAPPDVAFVGRIALAHAAYFPDGLEGIARAKAEILSHVRTRVAIVHAETRRFEAFQEISGKSLFLYDDADFYLKRQEKGWRIVERGVLSPEFSLPFDAAHLRENFLGAVAVARVLGLEWEEILESICNLRLIPRRFEQLEKGGALFINDAYNANPTSVRAALENLPAPRGGKRVGVLGEMRELGGFSATAHREIGELALEYIDELLCFGAECAPMAEAFAKGGRPVQLFADLRELKQVLEKSIQPGDVVLIKGSNSKKMWTLLE